MALGHGAINEHAIDGAVAAGGGAASFTIAPVSGHATGTIAITATGSGTTWTGANPFSVTGGTGTATINTYANISGTSATFNLALTVLGTIIISDSNSGTTQTYNGSAVVPGAPTAVSGAHGNTQVVVSFTAPADNGGASITGYTATSTPGSFTASGASSPLTVTGLTNGTSYTFTVHATNSVGNGPESSASSGVVPSTTPGVPTGPTASAGNAQAFVTYTAPGSDGGDTITSYTATSTPGSITGTLSTSGSGTITVNGLTNGTAYTFTVHATNTNGNSTESSATSPAVTPTASTTVHILVRAPYLSTDTIGTKTYQVYQVSGGTLTAVGSGVTTGFSAIPHITNGWWVDIPVTPNGSYGDFSGIAVFDNINGGKVAIELYSPPTSVPSALVVCKIAPYLAGDTITTAGYQLYDMSTGATFGSLVTTGIYPITGITNGYATSLSLTPDTFYGAKYGILWQG